MEACDRCNKSKASGDAKDGHTVVAGWAANETRQVAGHEVAKSNAKIIY